MRMENWSVVFGEVDPYTPPELATTHLRGKVYGHDRFTDGEVILTSAITGVCGDHVITTSGSAYELGEPDPEYEYLFPDAKNRVLSCHP